MVKYDYFLAQNVEQFIELTAQKVFELVKDYVQQQNPSEKYLTRKELSKILQISDVTLNQYCKEGIIPSYRIGSSIRFKLSDIDKAVSDGFRKYTCKNGGVL